MGLSSYRIRNEYSLADTELYRAADDDPEALLGGVAMAGLVGVLRQLGDLAEFAAEIFHDLHEEVTATSARGHSLIVRLQKLETEFPLIEKAFLSQTDYSAFFSNAVTDWHPSLHTNQNLITRGDLPRFVMDSYEECHGPPRLFLLDKFDVAGAGACSKRYTDPSFFKVGASSYKMKNAEVQGEKKSRNAKKKGSRWRNGETTPEILTTSHAKLHQLFLEERVENGVSDPSRHVKLKRRLNGFQLDSKTSKSYMEKFINTSSPEDKVFHEISYSSSTPKFPSNISNESRPQLLETSAFSSLEESEQRKRNPYLSPCVKRTAWRQSMDDLIENLSDENLSMWPKVCPDADRGIISSPLHELVDEKERAIGGENKAEGSKDGYQSHEIASEVDNYMDAPHTMDSEIEMDSECRFKNYIGLVNIEKRGTDSDSNEEQLQAQFSDSKSIGYSTASDDGTSSSNKGISNVCDRGSSSAGTMPVDVDVSANVSPSRNMSVSEEVTVSHPPECEGSHNACIDVDEITSYGYKFEEPSSSSWLTDSALAHLPDEEEILTGGTFMGAELVEISSNHNELDNKLIGAEENETYQDVDFPGTSKHSNLPSHTRNNVPHTDSVSVENHFLDKLDGNGRNALSSASFLFSDILESGKSLLDNVLETEHAEDSYTKNSVDSEISQPHSVISHAEDELFVPGLLEYETYKTDLKPGAICSVDDVIPSGVGIHVISTSALDNSNNVYFAEQQGSESANDAGEEIGDNTPSVDLIGSVATKLGISSDFSKSTGPQSLNDHQVHLYDKVTEIDHSENIAMAVLVASPNSNADEADVDSPSMRKLRAEYEYSIHELNQNEFEVNKECRPQSCNKSGIQKEVTNQDLARTNLDPVLCETVYNDHSQSELLNCVSDSFLVADAKSILHRDESTVVPPSPKSSGQHPESISPHKSNLIEMLYPEHKNKIQSDQFDMENLHLDEIKSKEICPFEQVESLGHIYGGHFIAQSEPCPVANEPEEQVDMQADRLVFESLHGDEARSDSSSKLEQFHFTNHTDHERIFNSSAESSSTHLRSKPRDPLSLVPPRFSLLKVPNINFEEMQPLPPLPPVQWMIGRPQHSMASDRDAGQHTNDHLPPMFPSKANNNTLGTILHNLPPEVSLVGEKPEFPEVKMTNPSDTNFPRPTMADEQPKNVSTTSEGEILWSTGAYLFPAVEDGLLNGNQAMKLPQPRSPLVDAVAAHDKNKLRKVSEPAVEDGLLNGNQAMKLPRPQSPLIDAVAAIDKNKLRKVPERVRPEIQKVEERDSLLEQIRAKAFNLKPAVATRPSIHGPKTNLKIVAILEKANAIRQALAPSDEDDGADSWSDS